MALKPCLNCGTLSRASRCPLCTAYYKKVITSAAWERTRSFVRVRDDNRCRECGATTGLQVHHIDAVGDGGNPFDVNELVTLCRSCHSQPTGIA